MEEEVVVLYRRNKSIAKSVCPCCEAENEPSENFCFFCGAALNIKKPVTSSDEGKKGNGIKLAVGIAAAAATLIALAFLALNTL